jgi:hypothetical protein
VSDQYPVAMRVTFLGRENSGGVSREEFEKRLAEITTAIADHAGSSYVESADRRGPSEAGSMQGYERIWKPRKITLFYSHSIENQTHSIPFRAGVINVFFKP